MTTAQEPQPRIPVICVAPSAVAGAELFNPNSWSGKSKGLVQSCWTEYSVLHYCVGQISAMCGNADKLCAKNVETLQQQWQHTQFDLGKVECFAQQPDLHIQIEAFFSGVKSLLDLIVQLLSTDQVVATVVNGFHRDQSGYGGRVLNSLKNNAVNAKKETAAQLGALISDHKEAWIDQVIRARDQLVHPEKGVHQLMFRLEFGNKRGSLVFIKAYPPTIDSNPIDQFAQNTLGQVTAFAKGFLELLHGKATSNT